MATMDNARKRDRFRQLFRRELKAEPAASRSRSISPAPSSHLATQSRTSRDDANNDAHAGGESHRVQVQPVSAHLPAHDAISTRTVASLPTQSAASTAPEPSSILATSSFIYPSSQHLSAQVNKLDTVPPANDEENQQGGSHDSAQSSRAAKAFQTIWTDAMELLMPEEKAFVSQWNITQRGEVFGVMNDISQSVEEKLTLCEQRRWSFSLGHHTYSVREEAEKVIKWLNRFKQAGDVAVNADPVHAGLPWALIRLLLEGAVSEQEQLGSLVLGIERITYILSRCKIYFDLYLDVSPSETGSVRSALQKALTELFARILKFFTGSSFLLDKNTFARAATAFWGAQDITSFEKDCGVLEARLDGIVKDFDRTLDKIRHKKLIEKLRAVLLELHAIAELRLSRLDILFLEHNKERVGKILHWISPIPHEDHHERATEGRTEGTGNWIFQRREFQVWNFSDHSMILWLHGIPGAGKTKLVSRVIDCFLEQSNDYSPLAYFYCNRAEDQRRLAKSVFQSFVKQLGVIQQTKLHTDLVKEYERKEYSGFASSSFTIKECVALLKNILLSLPTTTLILDALDECHEFDRAEIISAFNQLIGAVPCLKVLISSRRNDDIKRQLRKEANVGIEARNNERDIRRFVYAEIVKEYQRREQLDMKEISPLVLGQIVNTLYEKSEGMFQWAALQVSQLLCLERESDILLRLGHLPVGLQQTYEDIMNVIKAQDGSKPQIALKTFKWIVGSVNKPHKDVLLDAVCQDPDTDTIAPRDIDVDYVLGACQNLVSIDTDGYCNFTHLSVREYFEEHVFSLADSQDLVLSISLRTLSMPPDGDLAETCPALQNFVLNGWCDQAEIMRKALDTSKRAQSLLISFLGSPMSPSTTFLQWHTRAYPEVPPRTAEITICLLGLSNVLRVWLTAHEDDMRGGNPNSFWLLCHAIAWGDDEVVRLLLQYEVDLSGEGKPWDRMEEIIKEAKYPDMKSSERNDRRLEPYADPSLDSTKYQPKYQPRRYTSLLEMAYEYRNAEAMNMLVTAGVDVSNPFVKALHDGKTSFAKYLLSHGANAQSIFKRDRQASALIIASRFSDVELVQMLIDNGADVNETRSSASDQNALLAASKVGKEGNFPIVQLLLDNGAVFDAGLPQGSALVIMCRMGRTQMARLVLDAGTDVNQLCETEIGDQTTALMAAVEMDAIDTVKMLIDRGANINKTVQGSLFGNALITAVMVSTPDIAKLLLQNGAHATELDVWKRLFMFSAEQYKVETIKLLLQHFRNVDAEKESILTETLRQVLHWPIRFPDRDFDDIFYLLLGYGAKFDSVVDESLTTRIRETRGCAYDEISWWTMTYQERVKIDFYASIS